MARLLLKRRSALLLFAALIPSMSACIIPVAPDFQDPLTATNVPPYLESCNHDPGEVVSIVSPNVTTFRCTVTDPNVNDTTIFSRVVFDYPPAAGATASLRFDLASVSAPHTGTSHTAVIEFTFSCGNVSGLVVNFSTPQHLMLVVADRAFVDDEMILDKTETGVFKLEVPWTVVFQCSGTQ